MKRLLSRLIGNVQGSLPVVTQELPTPIPEVHLTSADDYVRVLGAATPGERFVLHGGGLPFDKPIRVLRGVAIRGEGLNETVCPEWLDIPQ